MLRLCKTHVPEDYAHQRNLQSNILDPGAYLYLKVKYFIIYNNQDQNISLQNVRAQHIAMNRDFDTQNPDIVRVPNSGNYNYASVVGRAKIRFFPLLADDILENSEYIERIQTNNKFFSGLGDVEEFVREKGFDLQTGYLHVYICAFSYADLLGEAVMFTASTAVNYRTVGSPQYMGDPLLVNYNQGRTLTHEVGHVLGLPHTFSDNGTCTLTPEFSDIPVQKNRNVDAYITNINGTYSGTLDNHFRDCNRPIYDKPGKDPPYSCSNDCGSDYEMFFNFMDYGNDNNSIMFSETQIQRMRHYLLSTNNVNLVDGPEEPPPLPTGELPPIPTSNPYNTSNSSKIGGWTLVAIVLGILTFLVLIGSIIAYRTRKL